MQKLAGKVGFLAKAVEDADYEGVKEFASDMKKLGVPLEHAPQVSNKSRAFCILTAHEKSPNHLSESLII